MSKGTEVTCKICKKKIKKETAYSPKERFYYCSEEEYNENLSSNEKKELVEKSDWTKLMDRLDLLYNKNCNFPLCCSQIKSMKNTHNFKDKGILYTINYMVDIEEIDWNEDNGLGLIPYYYNKASDYFKETQRLKKELENFEFKDEIRILKRPYNKEKNNRKNIDISQL